MVVYETKRNWRGSFWFLILLIPVLLVIWFTNPAGSIQTRMIAIVSTTAFISFFDILSLIFLGKKYKLEIEKGLIKETYGKEIKEVEFKSLDLLDGTKSGAGSGNSGRISFVYPEFNLTLADGSKQVFIGRWFTKLTPIIKAIKEIYPEAQISKLILDSATDKAIFNR